MIHWLRTWWINWQIRHGDRHSIYVYYTDAPVARTIPISVEGAATPIMVDLSGEGDIIGVEMLNASRVDIDGRPAR